MTMLEKLQSLAATLDKERRAVDKMVLSKVFSDTALEKAKRKIYERLTEEKDSIFSAEIQNLDTALAAIRRMYDSDKQSPEVELLAITKMTNRIKALPTKELSRLAEAFTTSNLAEIELPELIPGIKPTPEMVDTFIAELRSRGEELNADNLHFHAYEVVQVAEPWRRQAVYKDIERTISRLETLRQSKDMLYITDGSELHPVELAGLARGLSSDGLRNIARNLRAELQLTDSITTEAE